MGTLASSNRFWGIFSRRERWGLSRQGWLVAIALVFLTGFSLCLTVYPFLAYTHRVDSHVLVVEGWILNYGIRGAVEEFKTGSYQHVFVTGGPISGSGGYINDYNTSASVGAGRLRVEGIPSEIVQMVPSRVIDRDRTYSSALALRDWFSKNGVPVSSFNVVTENTHARRTRLLFQRAFGNTVKVGIVAIKNPDYDASRWWRYSEGVKDVFSESVGYLYARLFFHPSSKRAEG